MSAFPPYRTSAHIEARNLCRETDNGVEEKEALRNRVLALADWWILLNPFAGTRYLPA